MMMNNKELAKNELRVTENNQAKDKNTIALTRRL